MKFVMKPSLEHMALVKIGILLWNQNDVKALISKLSDDLYHSKWQKIEERITEKVLQLSLPQLLKEKVFGVIKPIGVQIFEWMQYYHKYDGWIEFQSHLDLNLPAILAAELCWTPQGTVDRKRTAEVLVKDESLNVSRRYRLACDYFLEDDIIRFWNHLPEDLKDHDWDYNEFPVISFWSDNMKREEQAIFLTKKYFTQLDYSNKVAAKYFLQKLTPQDREECLEEFAEYIDDADVLCFLLSEMEEEEQMLVFKSDPYGVLQCFLQWPFQGFFIGVANCMWDFLSRDNYDEILGAIICKVRDGYKDYNYQKLLGEFWQKSPHTLKDSLIEEIDSSWLMLLFDIKDKENIRLILKDVTITAKEKLIYSNETKNICQRYICDNKWDFHEFFIRECFPSKNETLQFKEEFEKGLYFKEYCSAKIKYKWNRLLCFSDDAICKYDKRSVERLCGFQNFGDFRSLLCLQFINRNLNVIMQSKL